MKKRHWSSKKKLAIVLEGIQGKVSISELCNHHEISQAQYYKWKDKLLKEGDKIFDFVGQNKEQERLSYENKKLKTLIGELTIELKKTEDALL